MIPSLAAWAGLGAGDAPPTPPPPGNGYGDGDEAMPPPSPSDPAEIRRKRLEKMMGSSQEGIEPMEMSTPTRPSSGTNMSFTSPDLLSPNVSMDLSTSMELEPSVLPAAAAQPNFASTMPARLSSEPSPNNLAATMPRATSGPAQSASPTKGGLSAGEKRVRRRSQILRRVLMVSSGSGVVETGGFVKVEFGGEEMLGKEDLGTVIGARLSMTQSELRTVMPSSLRLAIPYLCSVHNRAGVELSSGKGDDLVLGECLQEVQDVCVSYIVSSLVEEDLFETSKDPVAQILDLYASRDPTWDGTSASPSSLILDELISEGSIEEYITSLLTSLLPKLASPDGGPDRPPPTTDVEEHTNTLRILARVLHHKQVVLFVPTLTVCTPAISFTLPAADSPEAATPVSPTMTAQQQNWMRMFMTMHPNGDPNQALAGSFPMRSGTAAEKLTLLGRIFSAGPSPKDQSILSLFQNSMTGTMAALNAKKTSARNTIHGVRNTQHTLLMSLLKGGAKANVLEWLQDCMLVNVKAGGDQNYRNRHPVSSMHMLLNVAASLTRACEPFFSDPKKKKLIDLSFVGSGGVYSRAGENAVGRLSPAADAVDGKKDGGDFNFITHVFFMALRAVNLGFHPLTGTYEGFNRHLGHMHYQIRSRGGDINTDPQFIRLHTAMLGFEVFMADTELLTDLVKLYSVVAELLLPLTPSELKDMPEFFVSDLVDLLLFVVKDRGVDEKFLATVSLEKIFELVVILLSEKCEGVIQNYNLRAKLGDLLFFAFVPAEWKQSEAEGGGDNVPRNVCCDGAGRVLLLSNPLALSSIAPSLLLLYGQVEHTGYYEKQGHRSRICSLLKFLWQAPEHRPAFAKIAEVEKQFLDFANGVLNEINELIVTMMENLPFIKTTQDEMKTAAWGAMSSEEQDNVSSKLSDAERNVKSALQLLNKALDMFRYLSSDAKINELFQGPQMVKRLSSALLYVLSNMLGSKGLELKVDNPDEYLFKPKEMLGDLCSILIQFAESASFSDAIATSGYYNETIMTKLLSTCKKLNLLDGEGVGQLEDLVTGVQDAKKGAANLDHILQDAPDEFLDPLTCEIMMDPVYLATSKNYCNRSTISQHLMNDATDPFNRQPLTIDEVQEATELKERIDTWIAKQMKAEEESKE